MDTHDKKLESDISKNEPTDFVEKKSNFENPVHEKNSQKGGAGIILLSFFFGLIGGLSGWWLGPKLAHDMGVSLPIFVDKDNENEKILNKASEEELSSGDVSVMNLVEKSVPAVVSIVVSKDMPQYRNFFDSPGFPFFFGTPFDRGEDENSDENPNGMQRQKIGAGSGFVVSSDGTIITNRHVVDDARAEYMVVTNDKKEYPARVLALDPVQDVAILKIDGENFSVLDLGDSDAIRVGQTVIAIGNSLGEFSNTVSKGIVSGLRRNLVAGSGFGSSERLSGIIQTDAAINPGNSGGPLLDLSGKVVGINVAMAQGAENISFSIPVNTIKRSLEDVKTTGKISSPFLGVRYALVTPLIQKENNLPFEYGILVVRGQKVTDLAVIPGSPADKAGIVENDIILEVDGVKMDSENELSALIGSKRVGDAVKLKVWHKGDIKDMSITLEERK